MIEDNSSSAILWPNPKIIISLFRSRVASLPQKSERYGVSHYVPHSSPQIDQSCVLQRFPKGCRPKHHFTGLLQVWPYGLTHGPFLFLPAWCSWDVCDSLKSMGLMQEPLVLRQVRQRKCAIHQFSCTMYFLLGMNKFHKRFRPARVFLSHGGKTLVWP